MDQFDINCPICNQLLIQDGLLYRCESCSRSWTYKPYTAPQSKSVLPDHNRPILTYSAFSNQVLILDSDLNRIDVAESISNAVRVATRMPNARYLVECKDVYPSKVKCEDRWSIRWETCPCPLLAP